MTTEPPVWDEGVDNGRFRCLVTRTRPYEARYTVTVAATGEVLHDAEVGLAYDARFGPDVDDVGHWQQIALKAIDAWLVAHGEEVPGEPAD
jgi:hypothetical protein